MKLSFCFVAQITEALLQSQTVVAVHQCLVPFLYGLFDFAECDNQQELKLLSWGKLKLALI